MALCSRCGRPVCLSCSGVLTRVWAGPVERACPACVQRRDYAINAVLIAVFAPSVVLASSAWAVFALSPPLGWAYLVSVPVLFASLGRAYYANRVNRVLSPPAPPELKAEGEDHP